MSKESFKHFIITPFNIDVGLKSRKEFLDFQFISNRFNFFQNLCYPSVYHQTNQNFSWLVFFDEETPNEFKKSIDKLQNNYPNFSPIYTPPNFKKSYPSLIKLIYQHLTPLDNYLITTWLDSDDAVANNFVESIQKQFSSQEFEYINFPFGYQVSQKGLFFEQYLATQFLSLIEKIDNDILTCKVMSHHYIHNLSRKGLPVRQVITEPLWLQLIHQDNEITKDIPSTSIPQPFKRLNSKFVVQNFLKDYIQYGYLESLNYYLQKFYFNIPLESLFEKRKIKNLLALINPKILQYFLYRTLAAQTTNNSKVTMSINEIKTLCKKTGKDIIYPSC